MKKAKEKEEAKKVEETKKVEEPKKKKGDDDGDTEYSKKTVLRTSPITINF